MKASPSFITLSHRLERSAPPFEGNDIKYPESLVRYFLEHFTKRGDKVLDPFAGLGTTLFTVEEMGRIPYGVEYDTKRYEWVAGQLNNWQNLIHGDSAKLLSFDFPKMDFCMTSPPYMPAHHKWNPLSGGNPAHAGYDVYLKQMVKIYKNVHALMKRGSYVVVQVDNFRNGVHYTPLVRDISAALSGVLRLEQEVVVAWKNPPDPASHHTHCLVFRKA